MACRPSDFGVVHSGCFRSLKTSGTVFQDQTIGWINAHPTGGFEEHVRERLTSFDLFASDDDREKSLESDRLQCLGDNGQDSSRGYRYFRKSSDFAREFGDFPNRLNRCDSFNVELLLFVGKVSGSSDVPNRSFKSSTILLLGHPPRRIEQIFWHLPSIFLHGVCPGAIMNRHGIGKGAIAVEDISCISFFGWSK